MNRLNKAAKKLFKDLKGIIDIPNLINYLKGLGYSTVFYNTPEGDQVLQAYDLPKKPNKAFTYSGITSIVFINNSLPTQNKIYSLLHELGHILLEDIDSDECYLIDNRVSENQAEAFAYAVLNYKRNNIPLLFVMCLVLTSAISVTVGYKLQLTATAQPSNRSTASITQAISKTNTNIISDNNTESVYVTKSGTRYHKPDCQYVRNNNSSMPITIEEANKSYIPCKVCKP